MKRNDMPVFIPTTLLYRDCVFHHSDPRVLVSKEPARAVETNSTLRPGGFQFDGKISRPVLENYLSRSVSMEGLLNGRG